MGDCQNAPVGGSASQKNGQASKSERNGDLVEQGEETKDDESNVQLNAR